MGNPRRDVDPVLNVEHPICDCSVLKYFNASPPLRASDGKSCLCEMNKFDAMLTMLAVKNDEFSQLVAVDNECNLFTRAWCVSELATAQKLGMKQTLLMQSVAGFEEHF